MAHYLVVANNGSVPIVHEATAKSIADIFEYLDLKEGESVEVWRTAGPKRTVSVVTEKLRRVVIE